jgi:hypothetical protein
MNTPRTYRFASFGFAAIVTIAMLLGVNHLAETTTASGHQLAAAAQAAQA